MLESLLKTLDLWAWEGIKNELRVDAGVLYLEISRDRQNVAGRDWFISSICIKPLDKLNAELQALKEELCDS